MGKYGNSQFVAYESKLCAGDNTKPDKATE